MDRWIYDATGPSKDLEKERERRKRERERERRGLAGAKVSQQGFRHVFQTRPPNFNQELLSPHPSIRVDEVLK